MHAELKVNDQLIILSDEFSESTKSPKSLGGTSVSLLLYVKNCEASFDQALRAGAKTVMEPKDMFWGDRMGAVTDPEGHVWVLGTHIEDVTPEVSRERIAAGAAD
jgi:PhnB protein